MGSCKRPSIVSAYRPYYYHYLTLRPKYLSEKKTSYNTRNYFSRDILNENHITN